MSNLQLIHLITNMLLNGPVEAYKISEALLKKGFPSDQIYTTISTLVEDNQLKLDNFWRLYLNPPTDCEGCIPVILAK
jgi:hypothetical protein